MDVAEHYRRPPLAPRTKRLLLVSALPAWAAAAALLLHDAMPLTVVVVLIAGLVAISAWASVMAGRDGWAARDAMLALLRARAAEMTPTERGEALAVLEREYGKDDALRALRQDLGRVPGAVVDPPSRSVPAAAGGRRRVLLRGVVMPVALAAGATALAQSLAGSAAGADTAALTWALAPQAGYVAGRGSGVQGRERVRWALLALLLMSLANASALLLL